MPVWFIDGKTYDLTEFMPKHPGGAQYLAFDGNDVSITFWSYHRDPKKNLKTLEKYRVEAPDAKTNKHSTPKSAHFLVPEDFDYRMDVKKYNFDPDNKDLFLNECRARVNKPDHLKRIRELDAGFDKTTMYIGAFYVVFMLAWLFVGVPWYISTPIFALVRTSLAGAGHYYTHRAQPCFWAGLFDINYVGISLTGVDGHNISHHAPTMSKADPKTGFFGAMMGFPRLLRMPAFTLHKLGHLLTGMFIKGVEVHTFPDSPLVKWADMRKANGERAIQRICWSHWVVHIVMLAELFLANRLGLFWPWFAQFFLTLWLNTLMVVSSHDFECQVIYEKETDDWGKFQLMNCLDLSITGNPWVDCFLSAGLSPHRAHHMFPWQKSGWANVYATRFVQEAAEKFGYKWEAPRSLQFSRLPSIFRAYILGPLADPFSRKRVYNTFLEEHIHWTPYWDMAKYIFLGFTGIGSL